MVKYDMIPPIPPNQPVVEVGQEGAVVVRGDNDGYGGDSGDEEGENMGEEVVKAGLGKINPIYHQAKMMTRITGYWHIYHMNITFITIKIIFPKT